MNYLKTPRLSAIFIGLFLFQFYPIISANAQSNGRAIEYLLSLRSPTIQISTDFLSYTKLVLLEGLSKKSMEEKKELTQKVYSGRKLVEEVQPFSGQNRLNLAYISYFNAMQNYLELLPVDEIESVEFYVNDSAQKFQKAHIEQLNILFAASADLKVAFETFRLSNHIVGIGTSGGLTPKQGEAVRLISFAVQMSNAVMNVRRLNRLFYVSLLEDTGQKAESIRQELFLESKNSKTALTKVPNFPGDLKLKKSALNNIRLLGMSAGREYVRLVRFREAELLFVERSLVFKRNRQNSEFDTQAYYEDVRKYSDLIKTNRKEIKALGKVRVNLENTFNKNFLNFIEERFLL